MRIHMIGQKGIPAQSGGVERHVEELAARLVALGHDVTAYARVPYTSRKIRAHRGVRIVHLPTLRTKHLEAIVHTFVATLHVLLTRPDVVHYHGIGPAALLWIPRLFLRRTTIVFTFHCQDYHHQKWNVLARLFLRVGEYIGVRFADEVITVSKTLTRYVQTAYLKDATYIPNGVSSMRPRGARSVLRSFDLAPRRYILAVSRLVRHKGIHELIAAYNGLTTRHDLVIAGDGAYTDEYVREVRALAAKNPRIHLLGNQSAETLAALYANATLVVHPSHAEGLSIVLLEAMRAGRCVLASNIPENKEVIDGAGYTFRVGSVADLRARLRALLATPARMRAAGLRAHARVRERYDWGAITRATTAVYTSSSSHRTSDLVTLVPHRRTIAL